VYNEITSQLNPIDFIRIDYRNSETPYQLSLTYQNGFGPYYTKIDAVGNRTTTAATK
jgi:hypothetical protein